MHLIVPARPEDATAIHAIQMRAFAEEGRLSESMQIPPLSEEVSAIELHIRTQTVLVARDGERIIGSARGVREGAICTIRGVSVEPSFQGRGVGALLLKAIEQAHANAERFQLTTNTLVPGNVAFYERHGYEVDELTQFTARIVLAQMSKAVDVVDATDLPVATSASTPRRHAPKPGIKSHSGSCLCGQVRIAVRGEPLRTGICHCTDCRQESGSAFTFYGIWPAHLFECTGETAEFRGRWFCPRCGSRLFSVDEREAEIKLGALSEVPTSLSPTYELWVKRREHWLRPVAGAEQHAEDRE